MRHPRDYIEHFPRKRFGQNFLVNAEAVDAIIDHSLVRPTDVVLEIGPGIGTLTEVILSKALKVVAIEKDRDLVEFLEKDFSTEISNNRLKLIEEDACYIDLGEIFKSTKFKVIANLPYNVSIPILFNFFKFKELITSMTLMFQKEVAERITANPGSKKFGVLAIHSQGIAEIYEVLNLLPNDFYPSPKVSSRVLKFEFLKEPKLKIIDHDFFQILLKAMYFQKRKKIINSLDASHVFKKIKLKEILRETTLDLNKRPEDLGFSEIQILYDKLYPYYRDQLL